MTRQDLIRIACDRPDAPEGVLSFTWMLAPMWAHVMKVSRRRPAPLYVSAGQPDQTQDPVVDHYLIERMYEDRHGGVRFWYGWCSEVRVAFLWVEE